MAIAVTLVVYAMNMVFLGWGPLEAERLGRVFVSGGPVAALVTFWSIWCLRRDQRAWINHNHQRRHA